MAMFVFKKSKAKVKERAFNDLDKKPGDYDIIPLVDEIREVLSRIGTTHNPKNNKSKKPQLFFEMPILMDLPAFLLKVARAIQRPYNISHAIDIAFLHWDSRRPLFPIVVYNPITDEYWIIEGNHTSIAIGARAATGHFSDVDSTDWENIKIRCQVVKLIPDEKGNVDMSFCRDHFTGTNGDSREPLDKYDFYKNHVLKVRQDYAGDLSKCDDDKAKIYYNLQMTSEKWDMFPVHPRSGRNTTLPGAITHTAAFMKLKVADVDFIGRNHKEFWDNEVVDAIELGPMSTLRKLIKKYATSDEFNSKEHKEFMYEMAVVMQKFGTTPEGFRAFAGKIWQEYYKRTSLVVEDKIPEPHKDFSLILWLKLHKKVGGQYDYIPASTYTRFSENGIDAVDCLPAEKKKIFKEFV
jgi:hypothetical protein